MERIGKEVERTLSTAGGGQGLALAEITTAWPAAVGEAISRNAWPLRLGNDDTLHVATTSSTWAFELDRMSEELAERLAAVLGDSAPARFRFRPGPLPEPGAEPQPQVGSEEIADAPETSAAATFAAAEIDDPELRELVARAAQASLRRGRSRPGSDRGFW
jgi:hypothetical protein